MEGDPLTLWRIQHRKTRHWQVSKFHRGRHRSWHVWREAKDEPPCGGRHLELGTPDGTGCWRDIPPASQRLPTHRRSRQKPSGIRPANSSQRRYCLFLLDPVVGSLSYCAIFCAIFSAPKGVEWLQIGRPRCVRKSLDSNKLIDPFASIRSHSVPFFGWQKTSCKSAG